MVFYWETKQAVDIIEKPILNKSMYNQWDWMQGQAMKRSDMY